jgi:hypothetical protein
MPRIDAAAAKIKAQPAPEPPAEQEWYRYNKDHVVMKAQGRLIHSWVNGKKQKVIDAGSHKRACAAIQDVCNKDTVA